MLSVKLNTVITFVILSFIALQSTARADELTLLFPSSHSRISYAPSGLLKALYTSSEPREFYLLKSDSVVFSVAIGTANDKEQFPQVMYDNFPEDFHISELKLRFTTSGAEIEMLSYNFSTERPLNLEDFWKTTDFRRILAKINNSKAQKVELRIVGWQTKRWQLNSFSRSGHIDMIGSSVNLVPGENEYTIQVRTLDYDLVYSDTLNYYYYVSNIADEPADNFQRITFHTELNQEKCSLCHQEILRDDCSFCHSSVQSQAVVHPPVEEMECNNCHDDSDYPKNQLMEDFQEDPEACLMCHGDVEDHIGEVENVHPPLDESCIICHDSHSSPYPFMLVKKTKNLCMTCHEDIQEGYHPVTNHPLEAQSDPRRDDRAFNCASCHDPHGSDEEYLLREAWMPMCDQCHVKN